MNFAAYLLEHAPDEAVALSDGGREYTYGDLRAGVSSIAGELRELGLPAGSPVGLMAPNGLLWVGSYLATMALGLVAVPLPVTLQPGEAAARVAHLGMRAVVLGRREDRTVRSLLAASTTVLTEGALMGTAEPVEPVAVAAADDAVHMFTSGTTGTPRVVRLTHGNLLANTASILGYLDLRRDDRMLVVLPFSYVFGASLLHTHLRVGATLVLQNSAVFPQSVVDVMTDERCTGLAGVPSSFSMLLRNSTFGHLPVPTLRSIQQAGGALPPVVLKELIGAQPQARVFVMYGATEATARMSYLPPELALDKAGSIGRGIPGVALGVRDEFGRPVRPGETGEIWARGDNISPGYLDDPAATAAKMPGGLLRTGDLATVDEDGYIYVVDRTEGFIKTWGHRVAGSDVEAVAMEVRELVHAAAVGVPDEAAGERVELVVVRRSGSTVSAEQVLSHCRHRLAKHAVPAAVHFVARLPLNANGKVVRSELRALAAGRHESG